MGLALRQAELAAAEDEIPVGAVLVKDGVAVLADHNRTRQLANPLAHAEKLIIDKILASKIKYLNDYSLYVTLEPCLMCSGLLILSRVGLLALGAADPKAGACGSVYHAPLDKSFNHHPVIVRGVLEAQCSALLKDFFATKR